MSRVAEQTLRAEPVGSLLRPDELLEARRRRRNGELSATGFKRVEDRAVEEAVELQESAGLPVVTDGEMRRLSFQSIFVEAVDGFGDYDLDAFLWGNWKGDDRTGDRRVERPSEIGVVGELERRRPLAAEEFVFLRGTTDRTPKITLPSPGLFANFWSEQRAPDAYPSVESFLDDVVEVLRREIEELVPLGAEYLQIDAPHYPLLLDSEARDFYEERFGDWRRALQRWIGWDNAVLEAVPEFVTAGFHLCRGNQESRWLVEGSYEPIAEQVFSKIDADRLLLEYDDERSGSFEPLRHLPDDKVAVLGLVTTKRDELESVTALTERLDAAAEVAELDQLAVSPQCGFSSSVVGNRISAEAQRRKLGQIVDVAGDVWGM